MNETQKYSSGQAQHLAEWKARQQQARGKIIYFPLARCEPEPSWPEKAMEWIGRNLVVPAVIILGLAVIVSQFILW
mgnify:CR=1 FL=1